MQQVFSFIAMVWGWLMDHLLYINLILSVVIVFFQRRDPKAVWTWLLVLYFVPIFGFLLYLVLCQDYHKSKMFRIKEVEDRLAHPVKEQERLIQGAMDQIAQSPWRDYESLVLYNLETSGAVLTSDNSVEIFTDGEAKFNDLKEELGKAEKYIHIQYYIIKNDELFQSIVPILKERAAAGVEVRVLYDGMGGRFMPARVWKDLRSCGIRVAEFFPPILGRLQLRVNYRNHRKIVVIDGKVGYVGGFNIGREYISKDPKFGYWRDTHLKICGSAVYSLQIRFALDWNYASKENLFRDGKYFGMGDAAAAGSVPGSGAAGKGMAGSVLGSEAAGKGMAESGEKAGGTGAGASGWSGGIAELASAGTGAEGMTAREIAAVRSVLDHRGVMMQIIASGPDAGNRQIRNNYIQLITRARRHIYIQTPYFIPDDAALSALKFAAESGVDVRLMIPCKPDHPFVYWATYSYMGDLLAAGAKCYTYENGFLHAKSVMVDGMVSCCGTANMDIRSFELNFEVNATIYDEGVTKQLEDNFREDLKLCREVTWADYAQRKLWIRFKEQCCRLLSPLL